jgi:hypothetical protein
MSGILREWILQMYIKLYRCVLQTTWHSLRARRSGVRMPAGELDFKFYRNVQTGSDAQTNFLFNGHRSSLPRVKGPGHKVHLSPSSRAKVTNQWSYISIPAIWLHGVDRNHCRLRLKCDGTRAETRIRLSAKRTSPFKSAWASVQSTTGSRGVRISGSNAGYTKFGGSVKGTGYPLHSPVSPSLPLPCVTVCHRVSTGLYPCLPLLTNAVFCKIYSIIIIIIIIINTAVQTQSTTNV